MAPFLTFCLHSPSYVDAATASDMNLTHATDSSFILRADSFNVVGEGERGRKSVRLFSKKTYTSVSLFCPRVVQGM